MFQIVQLENTLWETLSMTAESGMHIILSNDKEALTELAGFMSGYRVPKVGKVLVDGQEADGAVIGYMPADAPLYEDMTVRQWLAFMAQLKGLSQTEAEQQAKDLMEMYWDPEKENQMLRKKMPLLDRKMAVLLQALTGTPSLLVLDQPAAGLEEGDTQAIYDVIHKIAEEYPVLLLLTDPSTAEMMEGTLWLFYEGALETVTVEQLHENYAQLYQEMVKEQLREEDDLSQILEDYEGGSRDEEPDDTK